MSNKDPFGMRRPAQQFKTMVETQRERADKAERQRDQLAEALRKIDDDLEGRNFLENSSLRDTARAALKAIEDE